MTNRNKAWERKPSTGATWHVFDGEWMHAIKQQKGSYRLAGDPNHYLTLAKAKDVALRRIEATKADRAQWARRQLLRKG